MSSPSTHPSTIYIGAVVAILVISVIGIVLRVSAVKRARNALRNPLPGPVGYPQRPQSHAMPLRGYQLPPMPPPSISAQNRPPLQETWTMPAPAYTPSYQPPTPQTPASPRFNNASTPPPRSFPIPQPAQSPRSAAPPEPRASPANPPAEVNFPSSPLRSAPSPPEQSSSLVERMREVQNLMLEIHRLESDTSSQNNRTRIQELQRRVTELSDTEAQPPPMPTTGAVNNVTQPPPYTSDGRDGS